MIESPHFYHIKGNGRLYLDKYSFKVSFQVFKANHDAVIYCIMDENPFFSLSHLKGDDWSIDGYTMDGEKFFATNLMVTHLNQDFVELFPLNNIIIGDYFDFTADTIEYPIANIFNINLDFSFEGYQISLSSNKDSLKKNISRFWGIPQVDAKIVIEKPNESIEDYTMLVNYIIRLLSLATGRHLSIGIQKFYSKTKHYTLIRNDFSSSNYIYSIVPDYELSSFLENAIPVLRDWSPDKFKDFKTILEYLNSTNKGFQDDRILKLVQCYEIISHKWTKSKTNLKPELQNLKNRMKKVIKGWQEDYPEFDTRGFWSGRIFRSLEWERTINSIENIITSQNLSLTKLEIDFEKLVTLRHSVAHSGRFGKVDNTIKDLIYGQFGLRIYLLKTLGYTGMVNDYRKAGYPTLRNISEFNTDFSD